MNINPFKEVYEKCNNGSNEEKYKLFQTNEIQYPKYIDIELTNYCNINCFMCPVGTKSMKRKRGYMSMDIIEKIAEELKKTPIKGVRLIRWGEPTLHKNFIDIVRIFKETGKLVHFNTNGTTLDEAKIKMLIDMQIDSIKFSFQGVDKDSYEEMRSDSTFEQVINNLSLLKKLRGDKKLPFIQVTTTTTYETEEQINAFVENVKDKCDYCNVGHTQLGHLDVNKMNISEEKKKRYLELLKRETLEKKHFEVCPEIFDKLSVNWDGSVSACCSDYDNLFIVGNIMDSTLVEIFNGEKIDSFRKFIRDNRYDDIALCKKCYQYI